MAFFSSIFLVIFLLFLSFGIFKSTSSYSPSSLLKEVFKIQGFSNIEIAYSSKSLEIIKADKSSENYLFEVKKDTSSFTMNNIQSFYEYAQKKHIHRIILVTYSPVENTSPIYKLVKEYDMDVWDYNKLLKLCIKFDATSDTEYSVSVLSTSDTSDDTCTQDDSFDPIQDENPKTNSIFSGLFNKTDRL